MFFLLTQEIAEVSPVFIIVFVAVIIGGTFFLMKKSSDGAVKLLQERFAGRIAAEYSPVRTKMCYSFVTQDEFILQKNQSAFVAIPLANIGYVNAYWNRGAGEWAFSVYDKDKKQKNLQATLLSGANGTRKYTGSTMFFVKKEDAINLCAFVMQHAPHVQILEK